MVRIEAGIFLMGDDGRFLRQGSETWYHAGGEKQDEAHAESTWHGSRCDGITTLWGESGEVLSEERFVEGPKVN